MQKDSDTSLLNNVELFTGLDKADLVMLEQHVTVRTYPKHAIVINEGDDANALYVVLSGQVKVFLSNEEGKEIIVNMLGPEEYFGELALLDSSRRSASVMTTEKSKLAFLAKVEFQRVLAEHSEIALNLIRALTGRVRILSENVKNLALLDVYGRVAKTLLGMATEDEGRLIVEKRLTQQDIANRVGASREMVARIMKDLVKGGYISVTRSQIIINEKLPDRY
ncbi:MAG: Crp/Fnr family transcriptional regulator [Gammaproteobacteria bacterium]|nr:Crp/Fnr family transcriptional regulator [Gammaproteobacteria bacterium]